MTILAPIGICTYGRLSHLKQNIEALKKNVLASASELYIFSDAPQEGDEEKVTNVRKYLQTIEGFKKVRIIERETNDRVYNNRGGMKFLIDNFGKCIFLEEDIVTAPGFLTFLNEALNFYENDENIFGISGYAVPIKIPQNYSHDVFVTTRISPWGIGVFKRTFDVINKKINAEKHNTFVTTKTLEVNGKELPDLIDAEIDGRLLAGDVRCWYYQIVHNKFSIHPRQSLVRNIGNDGSGVHMKQQKIDKYDVNVLWTKTDNFVFSHDLEINQEIQKEFFEFWSGGHEVGLIKRIIVHLLRKVGMLNYVKRIYFTLSSN